MPQPFAKITFPDDFESTSEVCVSLAIKYRENPRFVLSAWIHFYLKTLYELGKGVHADGLKLMLESWAQHPFDDKDEIDPEIILQESPDPYGETYVLEFTGPSFPATVKTRLPRGANKNRLAYAVVALAEAIFSGEDRKYLALSIDLIGFHHVGEPYSKLSSIMGVYKNLLPRLIEWKLEPLDHVSEIDHQVISEVADESTAIPAESDDHNLSTVNEEQFFEQAWTEIEERRLRKGLWARLYEANRGDDAKTKAAYIGVRVSELQQEQLAKEKAEQQARVDAQRRAKEQAEKLAKEKAEQRARDEAKRKFEELEFQARVNSHRRAKEHAERRAIEEEKEKLARRDSNRRSQTYLEQAREAHEGRTAKKQRKFGFLKLVFIVPTIVIAILFAIESYVIHGGIMSVFTPRLAEEQLSTIKTNIHSAISKNWNKALWQDKPMAMIVDLEIDRAGEVKSLTLRKSSGDWLFDHSVENAIKKSSPLPIPRDFVAYDSIRNIELVFRNQ